MWGVVWRFGGCEGSEGCSQLLLSPSYAVAMGIRQEKEQEGRQGEKSPRVLVFWAFPRPHAALSMWWYGMKPF